MWKGLVYNFDRELCWKVQWRNVSFLCATDCCCFSYTKLVKICDWCHNSMQSLWPVFIVFPEKIWHPLFVVCPDKSLMRSGHRVSCHSSSLTSWNPHFPCSSLQFSYQVALSLSGSLLWACRFQSADQRAYVRSGWFCCGSNIEIVRALV